MRRPPHIFTLYDKDGTAWRITEIWAHTPDGVPLESELWTTTAKGVQSHVTHDRDTDDVYRVVDNGTILTTDPPA